MSDFYTLPDMRPLNNAKRWALLSEHSYDVGYKGSGNTIVVPKGFITDLTSVPRIFISALPKWGRYVHASIIHDWLYWEQAIYPQTGG